MGSAGAAAGRNRTGRAAGPQPCHLQSTLRPVVAGEGWLVRGTHGARVGKQMALWPRLCGRADSGIPTDRDHRVRTDLRGVDRDSRDDYVLFARGFMMALRTSASGASSWKLTAPSFDTTPSCAHNA